MRKKYEMAAKILSTLLHSKRQLKHSRTVTPNISIIASSELFRDVLVLPDILFFSTAS